MNKELHFLNILRNHFGIRNITDDCAKSATFDSHLQLVSTDMLVQGNHFSDLEDRWDLIGQKAIAVNVSDIYSSGGKPDSIYISLAIPKYFEEEEFVKLYQGIMEACSFYGVSIKGGDITSTKGPLVINVTVVGYVHKNEYLPRSGAKIGDLIFVTGDLGKAKSDNYELWERYYRIVPVDKVKKIVASAKARSMADVSDGLTRTVYDICSASRVGADIYLTAVPLAEGTTMEDALDGGEDFQMVFTVPKESLVFFEKDSVCIGEITGRENGICLIDNKGNRKELDSVGYDHFNYL